MQGKHWLVVVSILVSAAFGCREPNPYHCPGGEGCPPVGGPCESSGECGAPTSVCNEQTMTCVECLVNTHCAPALPVCSDQNTCVQCQVDDDCDSKLCLTGGVCADPGEVTYVGGAGAVDNPMCSLAMPCQNLEQGLKAMALRKYIKLTGAVVEPNEATIAKAVTIYGRSGAQISRSIAGEVLIIKGFGTPAVALLDLEIVGNLGSAGKDCVEIAEQVAVTMTRVHVRNHNEAGISLSGTAKLVMSESQVHDNRLEGVNATGGTLEIRRSKIYLNRGMAGVFATGASMVTIESSIITRNTGMNGGVSIVGPLSIKNSIISANGDAATAIGGLFLNSSNATFEFNTVAENISSSTPDLGMSCAVPLNVANSILTGNLVNGCNVTYSLADTLNPGDGNKIGLPLFQSTDAQIPLSPMFYRIMAGSPARDSADPAATLDVDIDGQARDDARKDMGADEYK